MKNSTIRCSCHEQMVSAREAEKIVLCADTLHGIRTGIEALKRGHVRSWQDVRRSLGIAPFTYGISDDAILAE